MSDIDPYAFMQHASGRIKASQDRRNWIGCSTTWSTSGRPWTQNYRA